METSALIFVRTHHIKTKDRLINLGNLGLKQLVNGITRRRDTRISATTIDLCFSNLHLVVKVLDDDGISDHRKIEVNLNVTQPTP